MKFVAFAFCACLVGCASTGVTPMDKGTYSIAKSSAGGMFSSPEGPKSDIYKEANEFCAKDGKTVETIKIELKAAVPFVRTSSAALTFRCV